jgi:hypothetical protein
MVQQRWATQDTERQSDSVAIAGCFVLFVAAWTLIFAILNMPTAIYGDMAEAYVWVRWSPMAGQLGGLVKLGAGLAG